jgi:hypothetical protein
MPIGCLLAVIISVGSIFYNKSALSNEVKALSTSTKITESNVVENDIIPTVN